MARIRVPVVFDVVTGAYKVNLPVYQMIPGSFQPITPLIIHADGILPGVLPSNPVVLQATVLCEVPSDHVLPGAIGFNIAELKVLYPWLPIPPDSMIKGTT